jgi:HSP90 family molecular chaperone
MDDAPIDDLPLRFVKGGGFQRRLPLNVSRELLQESRAVKAIRDASACWVC